MTDERYTGGLVWLSFAHPERGFLGVSIVRITEADLVSARRQIAATFPHARPGAEVAHAACTVAWALQCNPGGEVLASRIEPGSQLETTVLADGLLARVIGKEELTRRQLI